MGDRSSASLLASFGKGIAADIAAVKAALTEPWSNGQTEGQITKLKLVKRQMYGRARLDLLRARMRSSVICRQSNCIESVGVDGRTVSSAKIGAVQTADRGPSTMEYKRIAVDTSKAVFTLHGIDFEDRPVLRRNLKRAEFEAFFAKLAPTEVAMEACGSSHHWARTLAAAGHQVRLIPPQYVKPFVKRGKNDSTDAEAICEAAGRPAMHFVPVKSAARQAAAMPLSVRDVLVRQRTQLVNALRGHASEFGIIAGRGIERVESLLEQAAAADGMPETAREMLAFLGEQIAWLDGKLAALEKRTLRRVPVRATCTT